LKSFFKIPKKNYNFAAYILKPFVHSSQLVDKDINFV